MKILLKKNFYKNDGMKQWEKLSVIEGVIICNPSGHLPVQEIPKQGVKSAQS